MAGANATERARVPFWWIALSGVLALLRGAVGKGSPRAARRSLVAPSRQRRRGLRRAGLAWGPTFGWLGLTVLLGLFAIGRWPGVVVAGNRAPQGGLVLMADTPDVIGGLAVELVRTDDPDTDQMIVDVSIGNTPVLAEWQAWMVDGSRPVPPPMPRWHLIASGDFAPLMPAVPKADLCRGLDTVVSDDRRLVTCRDNARRALAGSGVEIPEALFSDLTFDFDPQVGLVVPELAMIDLDSAPTNLDDVLGVNKTLRSTPLGRTANFSPTRAAVISSTAGVLASDNGYARHSVRLTIPELPAAWATQSTRAFRLPSIGGPLDDAAPERSTKASTGPKSPPSENCSYCILAVGDDGNRVTEVPLAALSVTITDLKKGAERVDRTAPLADGENTLSWHLGNDDLSVADVETSDLVGPTSVEFDLTDPAEISRSTNAGFLAGVLASGAVSTFVLTVQSIKESRRRWRDQS